MAENGTIDDRYFEWLYGQIASVSNRNPSRSYWELARQLYQMEFIWFIPNDDNRAGDGIELRNEYMYDHQIDELDTEWLELECSVLEMLIALSKRAAFDLNEDPMQWFWVFMENIGLRDCCDEDFDEETGIFVEATMNRVLNRNYKRNGDGGFFPLRHPRQDQRKVELWYQLSSYILERDGDCAA